MTVRVFVVAGHETDRERFRAVFEGDQRLTVVGEAATAEEGTVRIRQARPDVAVIDGGLSDGSGIELCRNIPPGVRCIVLGSCHDENTVHDAVMAGASACLPKRIDGSVLIDDICIVAAGSPLLEPGFARQVLRRTREMQGNPRRRHIEQSSVGARRHQVIERGEPGMENWLLAQMTRATAVVPADGGTPSTRWCSAWENCPSAPRCAVSLPGTNGCALTISM